MRASVALLLGLSACGGSVRVFDPKSALWSSEVKTSYAFRDATED